MVETLTKMIETLGKDGPAWLLLAITISINILVIVCVVKGIKQVLLYLFDTSLNENGKPKGLLIPTIKAHEDGMEYLKSSAQSLEDIKRMKTITLEELERLHNKVDRILEYWKESTGK